MISTETRKFILKLILVLVCFERAYACVSNKKLYTEIGCKPIHTNDSSSCPIAYNCENVFTRPSNKCYFKGNVYEPRSHLSDSDSAKNNPCLAACFCDERCIDNKTTAKFICANVECPRYFAPVVEPCYFQFDRDGCCEIKINCPNETSIVHKCTYDGKTYKDGQRIYIDDYNVCVCSPEFHGAVSEKSCRTIDCNYEMLYMEKIVGRSAPVYFESVDGCTVDWLHPDYDGLFAREKSSGAAVPAGHECKYGNLNFPIGQQLTVGRQSDSDTYNTTCSCNVPPLLTCTKSRI